MLKEREEKVLINEVLNHIENETDVLVKQVVNEMYNILDSANLVKKIIKEHFKPACTDPAAAEKLLNKEKSVLRLYNIIKVKSREKELTPADAERIADEYYGLKE